MFSNHVNEELSAYCNGELPSAESQRVAEHLIGCPQCRAEFEEIKLGLKLAEQMPRFAAPPELWANIEVQLNAQLNAQNNTPPAAVPQLVNQTSTSSFSEEVAGRCCCGTDDGNWHQRVVDLHPRDAVGLGSGAT